MLNTPSPGSETAPLPSLKRLASSTPVHSPKTLEGGGVYCVSGAFIVFFFNEKDFTTRRLLALLRSVKNFEYSGLVVPSMFEFIGM